MSRMLQAIEALVGDANQLLGLFAIAADGLIVLARRWLLRWAATS